MDGTNPYLTNSVHVEGEREKLFRRQAARYADLNSIKSTQKLLTSLEQIHHRELYYEKEQKKTLDELEKKRRESVIPFVEITAKANIELLNSVSHQETPFGFSFSQPLIDYWKKNPHVAVHTLTALCLMCRQHDIFKLAAAKIKFPVPAISEEEKNKCVLIGMRTYPFPVVYGQWTDRTAVKECNTVSGLIKNSQEVTILSHSDFERSALKWKLQEDDKKYIVKDDKKHLFKSSLSKSKRTPIHEENAASTSIEKIHVRKQKEPKKLNLNPTDSSEDNSTPPLVIDEEKDDASPPPVSINNTATIVHNPVVPITRLPSPRQKKVELPVKHSMNLRSSKERMNAKKPDFVENVQSRAKLHKDACSFKRMRVDHNYSVLATGKKPKCV